MLILKSTPAPDEDVRPWAKYYFERGYKAKEIADKLKKHYDQTNIS